MNIKRKLATLALTLAGVFFVSLPASAHAELESSSPSSGETVEAGNMQVALLFGEDVLSAPDSGNVISVQGPSGSENAQWADGCVDSVRGALVSESVSLSLPGNYVVDWRAVSTDGHPIEGSYEFTLVNTTNYESQPPGLCETSQISQLDGKSQLLPFASDSDKSQPAFSITPEEGLIGGIVVIAIISVIGAFMLRSQERKRESREHAEKLARQKHTY
jgi:methionine-rich copper-binding protein CopC